MRHVYAVLPILFGLALGLFLVNPPDLLIRLGFIGRAAHGFLILGLFLGFVGLTVVKNLPESCELTPISGSLPSPLRDYAERFERLGFVPTGPPLNVGIAPPASLVAYVHPDHKTYGSAYRTHTIPPRTSFDFVSVLAGGAGGLTSNTLRAGAILPLGPGGLRQVIEATSVEELFSHHVDAVDFLQDSGIEVKAVSAETFDTDFRRAILFQREAFVRNLPLNTLITVWRHVSRRNPHVGRLDEQAHARRQIAELRRRGRSCSVPESRRGTHGGL